MEENITSATSASEIAKKLKEKEAEIEGELVEMRISDFEIYCVTLSLQQIPFPRRVDPTGFVVCRTGKYHWPNWIKEEEKVTKKKLIGMWKTHFIPSISVLCLHNCLINGARQKTTKCEGHHVSQWLIRWSRWWRQNYCIKWIERIFIANCFSITQWTIKNIYIWMQLKNDDGKLSLRFWLSIHLFFTTLISFYGKLSKKDHKKPRFF